MIIRLACAQFTARNGDIAANLATIDRLAGEAARQGAALLVLPELAVTGYARPEVVAALAEPIPGPSARQMAATAIAHGIALATGVVERDEASGRLHNSMLLLDREGRECLRYRKVHLWDTEQAWAAPGDSFPVTSWHDTTVGLWICYDSRFPEAARTLAKAGAHLALAAAAWLGPAEEWELALRARAMDNGIFVAGSVHLGRSFHGEALIIDPHGRILARGRPGADEVIWADLDFSALERFHQRIPLLRHLRPEAYT
jgi:predicted amidohydrolase